MCAQLMSLVCYLPMFEVDNQYHCVQGWFKYLEITKLCVFVWHLSGVRLLFGVVAGIFVIFLCIPNMVILQLNSYN